MSLIVKGRVWKLGNNVDTDLIIPGRYLTLRDPLEKAKHALEAVIPGFAEKVREGDVIVAGRNFGSGSSREDAVTVLKTLGIKAVIAESFARIFFRNALNNGLPVLECKGICSMVENGDMLSVHFEKGEILNLTSKEKCKGTKLPAFLVEIIREGGILKKLRKELQCEK